MNVKLINLNIFFKKVIFLLLGLFFFSSGLMDSIYLNELSESLAFMHFPPRLMLLIFVPGLKLCLAGIFIFYPNYLKSASMTAFLFLLVLLSVFIYKALTVKTCGVCGEFKKNSILFNVWKPVIIYFIVFIFNSVGFFLIPDSDND